MRSASGSGPAICGAAYQSLLSSVGRSGTGLRKFPNVAKFFRDMPRKIPKSIAQGIRLQAFEFAGLLAIKNIARRPYLAKFPVNFPLTRELGAETGS
jgi:hypothetical protein